MKILILSDANSIHTYRWSKAIVMKGNKVSVFSLSECKNKFSPSYEELGVDIHSFKLHYFVFNKFKRNVTKLFYFLALIDLKKIISNIEPDIIHAHYLTSYGIIAYLSKFKPYYISVWGDDIFLPIKNKLIKKVLISSLKNSNKVFSTSRAIHKTILEKYRVDSTIIPFGVNVDLFKPILSKKSNEITIGIIKSIEPHNGIEYLIDAFKILDDKNIKNIKLNIVGVGQSLSKIKKLVIDYNLKDKVEFFGHVAHHDILAHYQKLSIFVCPSLRESFGVSVIEASACGIPVVANKISGLKEVVNDKKTGYLIDTSNAKLLAEYLEKLIINDSLRHFLGKNGREFIKKNYSWDKSVIEMNNHYKKINFTRKNSLV